MLGAACAPAGLTVRAVAPRGVHERGRSVARVVAATVEGASETRDVLFVVHGTTGTPLDGGVVLERDDVTLSVWRFPFDPALPGLPSAVSRQRVRELLDTIGAPPGDVELRTRAYRPTRRAVVEVRITAPLHAGLVVYLKVLSGDRAATIADVHRQLGAVAPVPRVVGVDERLGIVVMEALGGRTLRAAFTQDAARPHVEAILDLQAAIAASELRSTADPRAFADPRRHVPVLARHFPADANAIAAAADTAAAIDDRVVPVHGDLHDGQVLVDDNGDLSGLLDVDGSGPGLLAQDAANLAAHLTELGEDAPDAAAYARELTEAYANVVDDDTFRRAQIGAWLALATGPHRAQMPDAEAVARRRLRRALALG